MKTCSVCGEQSELGRPEEHSTYSACVRALKSQLARQRALLQRTLDIAGGFIGEDGDVHFTSEGYGAWTRRKGGQRTQEILAENERLRAALDMMLTQAQNIRIQQVQATATWEQHYKDKGNESWRLLNEVHRAAIEGTTTPTIPESAWAMIRRSFMTCCSVSGEYYVKIEFRDLKEAQELYRLLVLATTREMLEAKPPDVTSQ